MGKEWVRPGTVLNIALVLILLFTSGPALAKKVSRLSDGEIKQRIVDESIESYPGRCACPFNAARNGSRCGGRSAWSKQGGYAPICYTREVTKEMIKAWREEHTAS